MKGKLHKTDNGWKVLYTECVPHRMTMEWSSSLPIHPEYVKCYFLDEDAEGGEVEFEVVEEPPYKLYAKLIKPEYPELEGTMTLCNDKIWDEIYDEYSTEQYPAFGGPFTDSMSFIDWLKQYYKSPEKLK